jgi:alkanesulfonate monooxygenase SsuD/methylene tetrahydromethanopterin reductase-like flavin-dependent oxidoreductase (luciferase family)
MIDIDPVHASPASRRRFHLAVALDGTGWHPGAWRAAGARPTELLTARYWTDLLAEAERGLLDFVTIEDSLSLQSADLLTADARTDQVRGRLDAVLVAARVAPTTTHIGIVPVATTTHTEPFHISKAIATLDYVSNGRAGWQVRVGGGRGEAALFGRRDLPELSWGRLEEPDIQQRIADLFDEAADCVEVVRRLWDSWQDDAVIKDAATGRYIDRDRLHYIDFSGRWFQVKGPSITPRPPQGQPVVTALAHSAVGYRLAARQADIAFVTPHDEADAAAILVEIRREATNAGRLTDVKVFADLVVFLDEDARTAVRRKRQLDELAGESLKSDARIFVGSAETLADELAALHAAGYDGFRLRPGSLPHDLRAITDHLVPELQRRLVFRPAYGASTLRERLGMDRPANRYEFA